MNLKEKVPSGVNAPTVLTHRKMPPTPTEEGIYVQIIVDTHPGNLLSAFRPLGTYCLCHRTVYPVNAFFVIFLNKYAIPGDFVTYNLKISTNASYTSSTFLSLSKSPRTHRVEAQTKYFPSVTRITVPKISGTELHQNKKKYCPTRSLPVNFIFPPV